MMSPSTAEVRTFPPLPPGAALATARTVSREAVISPAKRLSASTSLVPVASAVLKAASVEALADTACVVAIDPSAGYAKLPPSATASGGALTAAVPAAGWFGITILIENALAPPCVF